MNLEVYKLDDQQKELCAILVMRTMLEDYSKDTGVSYDEAFPGTGRQYHKIISTVFQFVV